MRSLLRRIESAWWRRIHPLWDEPERDETTPVVIADWISRHKHPAACSSGCQCKHDPKGGGEP